MCVGDCDYCDFRGVAENLPERVRMTVSRKKDFVQGVMLRECGMRAVQSHCNVNAETKTRSAHTLESVRQAQKRKHHTIIKVSESNRACKH